MTKLEQQMLAAVEKAHYDFGNAVGGSEDAFIAEAVTKIALELAYESYHEGWSRGWDWGKEGKDTGTFKQFIQDYE